MERQVELFEMQVEEFKKIRLALEKRNEIEEEKLRMKRMRLQETSRSEERHVKSEEKPSNLSLD